MILQGSSRKLWGSYKNLSKVYVWISSIFFSQLQKLHVIHVLYNDNDLLSYILHPVVHRYDFNIFITSSSSFHGFITNQFNDLLSVGMLA